MKLGRLAPYPQEVKPRLRLGDFLTNSSYPPPPASMDYLSNVADWPMYGNDQWGDCVWAMIAHVIEAVTCYGQGTTVEISDADVLKGYSDVTGFDPHAGPPGANPTDQGTVIQDALDYWRKTGVGGHKIVAFAQVDVKNPTELDAALAIFGHLCLGINFPNSAMDQFNNGQPWDVVPNDGGIDGGHAINDGGYNLTAGLPPEVTLIGRTADGDWEVVTWGRRQRMTQAFFAMYCEEAWTIISPEWISANGTAPDGLDVAAFNTAFTALTGQPAPLPVPPSPTPVPPAPTPTPPADPDATLATVAHWWADKHHHYGRNAVMAKALEAWLTATGR